MKKKKLLIIYTNYSTFVERDQTVLSKEFEVEKYHFKTSKKMIDLSFSIIKQIFYLLINIFKFDKIFIWFSDYHSLFPILLSRLFKKKSYLVIGGYDATGIKQISYGIYYSNTIRKAFNRLSIKYAHYILPVDKSLIKSFNSYASQTVEPLPVGIKHIVKNPKGEIVVLPTGYDTEFWKRDTDIKRKKSVVCVASIKNQNTWILKGGDLLLEIAKITPNIHFYFYGISDEFILKLKNDGIPSNFHAYGYIDNKQLPQIYSKHKVYAQFSLSEGLPNVLCEAILCECIPVGSNVNGILSAILNPKYILKEKDVIKAKKIILTAINAHESEGLEAREAIKTKFNEANRKTILFQYLK